MILVLPPALAHLRIVCASEEIASSLRHRVVGEVAGIGAVLMTLRRRLGERHPDALADPSIRELLDGLDDRVVAVGERLPQRSLAPPAADCPPVGPGEALAPLVEAASGLPVRFDCHGPEMVIDRRELALAVACLLENAIDAGSSEVVVSSRQERKEVIVEVADDGGGLAEETVDHLFDPFFSSRPGRLGLGLKIARRLARRWGGDVMVTPRVPRGACAQLALRLPR
jgi:signal transduction histidine kinase